MMDLKKKAKEIVNKIIGASSSTAVWNMSTPEDREKTVQQDYDYSKSQRSEQDKNWVEKDNYYNNKHVTANEIYATLQAQGIPWTPAVIPDSYIHVESQIIPDIPDFEFNGRDDDLDSRKAKQREYVVKYVLENNKVENMNTKNERKLNTLGNAFWKVAWDGNKEGPGYKGDIIIGNPGPENMFNDPAAIDLDDSEFIIYNYRMHKRKASREFWEELKKLDKTIEEIGTDGRQTDTQIFENQVRDLNDDTVEVIEYWFRQNEYGSQKMEYAANGITVNQTVEWEPGDIACSIQINNTEVKYIPKYWIKTGKQNKLFPFVKYCKIPSTTGFWDKSDLDAIKDLQDQEDRELAVAILNDAFMSNDIVIMEENALADGSTFQNVPGGKVLTKAGQINNVRRLGGLGNPSNRLEMINFLRNTIQETVGNFDSSQGKEPIRVTTASGIAQLNEKADARKNIKKADRLTGFERLYELIDWTSLEFYDDDRMIFIGAKEEGQQPIIFKFNSDRYKILDGMSEEPTYYYPRVDAVVNAGDGVRKSKAFTLAAIENLISKPINAQNYKLVTAMVDIMDLPNRKEIKEWLDGMYNTPPPTPGETTGQGTDIQSLVDQLSPEELEALDSLPDEEKARVMQEVGV